MILLGIGLGSWAILSLISCEAARQAYIVEAEKQARIAAEHAAAEAEAAAADAERRRLR